ncbi:MAG: hypothetical protein JJW00_07070 [Sulfurimonas sp.]|nr:hypothetical protein [Sulfurimonas sp.]
MWGFGGSLAIKKDSEILFGLFSKYSSNVESGTKLYRGMSLSHDNFINLGYNRLQKDDLFSPDNKAIVSFSKSKRVAFDFANNSNRDYKIIILTKSNNKNIIDISKVSTKLEEEETIFSKNIKRINRWILIKLEEK